ncbi:DUF427 domain-containing protein [Stappia sp. F7233]|uniref:DUF427 domain-containing protein n=1 Tax=Stappia albiluteola TaxID=2758565 RepID=A0A839AFK1_9HYPH|nr:DUF427 domain-containing protein [Stappia albiluteola]MBA5777329.1 DUF427 domain-containing protein [Stappia albiluteola]
MAPDEIIVAWKGHIRMSREPAEVIVKVDGVEIARSRRAIRFSEGTRADVFYIPMTDVRQEGHLGPSELKTTCKWKGQASYFTVAAAGNVHENLIWAYPDAFDEVAQIRDCIAFDTTNPSVEMMFRHPS